MALEGSTEVSLRSLGADRTLLLINGRRMAPSGIEGAPVNPDDGLIPGSLVGQYDLLLDGASPVYGSDVIGGIANITHPAQRFRSLRARRFPDGSEAQQRLHARRDPDLG